MTKSPFKAGSILAKWRRMALASTATQFGLLAKLNNYGYGPVEPEEPPHG